MTPPIAPTAADDWDHHWESYSEAAEENPGQRYRHRLACRLLKKWGCTGGARILDLGSGQGDLCVALRRAFERSAIAGLELSAAGVAISSRKAPTVQFFQRNLYQPADEHESLRSWAEYAVCVEVLEHLDEPRKFLQNAAQYLRRGCTLIVTVPGGPMSEFDRAIGHRRHYACSELRSLLEDAGFEVRVATGAGFPFFNLYRLAVILRGRRLMEDVRTQPGVKPGLMARVAMAVFRALFRANLFDIRWGWQTVAIATWPGVPRP